MATDSVGYAVKLAKSRRYILECLAARGFNVAPFTGFSVSSVHQMSIADDLDMLVTNPTKGTKALVKYHDKKALRSVNISDYVDDYFAYNTTLDESDELIIISRESPNDSVKSAMNSAWYQHGVLLSVIPLRLLQFNVLEHSLVPPHYVLTQSEEADVRRRFNVTDDSQLPSISRFDTVAMLIGLRPGQVCRVERPSRTAINTAFYRICSA